MKHYYKMLYEIIIKNIFLILNYLFSYTHFRNIISLDLISQYGGGLSKSE